jgi:hypothetical protein
MVSKGENWCARNDYYSLNQRGCRTRTYLSLTLPLLPFSPPLQAAMAEVQHHAAGGAHDGVGSDGAFADGVDEGTNFGGGMGDGASLATGGPTHAPKVSRRSG